MKRIYLDYAATTPADPEVVKAMKPFFSSVFGNPSAIHFCGQETRTVIEDARAKVAASIGALPEEIIFTSGGTEADNTATKGVAWANRTRGDHIITTTIEHHALHNSCHFLQETGFKVTYLPTDKYGMVDPQDVKKAITPGTILISVMHANNEVGTIEPVREIGKIAKEAGVYFHTDAVQTVGHIPVNVNELHVDLLASSAHKFYGPKGTGFLFVRKGTRIVPFMDGGGQERGLRAGTENVPGVAGMAKALELAAATLPEEMARQTALRDGLIAGLQSNIEGVRLNGHPTMRLPNNINVTIDFVEGEAMLLNLDMAGICASSGSACSTGSGEPSHVLSALGIAPAQAYCSLRFTLGKWSTEQDIERLLEVLPPIVAKLREMSPLARK